MSKTRRRIKAAKRAGNAKFGDLYNRLRTCSACGEPGPHFVPPSFGDEGFFMCTQMLDHGKAVQATVYGNENFADPVGLTLAPQPFDHDKMDTMVAFVRENIVLPPGYEVVSLAEYDRRLAE